MTTAETVADLYNSAHRKRRTVLDARRYENSIRFNGGERHPEIEGVGDGVMRKLHECSRPSEADSTQRQVVTAEVRSSQRQRPPDVAVIYSHAVHVGQRMTGSGNAPTGGSGGRLAVKML